MKRLYTAFVALLVMALDAAPAWAQLRNHTIYRIAEGWTDTANGQSVTVSGSPTFVPFNSPL